MYTIYSKPGCSYCVKAKDLLKSKNLPYRELVLDSGQNKELHVEYYTLEKLRSLIPSVRTVPQIFYNDELIGGYDALKARLG